MCFVQIVIISRAFRRAWNYSLISLVAIWFHTFTLGTIISSRETLGKRLILGTCHVRQDSSTNASSPKTEAAHKEFLAPIGSISAALAGIPEKRLVEKECGLISRSAARNRAYGSYAWEHNRILRTIKQVFRRGEGGEVGEFSSWMNIFFYFHSILPFTSVLFWYSPPPLPHNFTNGPSLIGIVPSHYIEGVQTGEWRHTRAAKPEPRRFVASRFTAGYPDKNCNNQGTQRRIDSALWTMGRGKRRESRMRNAIRFHCETPTWDQKLIKFRKSCLGVLPIKLFDLFL